MYTYNIRMHLKHRTRVIQYFTSNICEHLIAKEGTTLTKENFSVVSLDLQIFKTRMLQEKN